SASSAWRTPTRAPMRSSASIAPPTIPRGARAATRAHEGARAPQRRRLTARRRSRVALRQLRVRALDLDRLPVRELLELAPEPRDTIRVVELHLLAVGARDLLRRRVARDAEHRVGIPGRLGSRRRATRVATFRATLPRSPFACALPRARRAEARRAARALPRRHARALRATAATQPPHGEEREQQIVEQPEQTDAVGQQVDRRAHVEQQEQAHQQDDDEAVHRARPRATRLTAAPASSAARARGSSGSGRTRCPATARAPCRRAARACRRRACAPARTARGRGRTPRRRCAPPRRRPARAAPRPGAAPRREERAPACRTPT